MIQGALRDVLLEAIDHVATEFVFLSDGTPVEDGGPYIVYVNDAMLREFGYTAEEVLGRSPKLFWGPETDAAAVMQLRRTISEFREAGGEFAVYRKDGSKLWVRFRGRALQVQGAPAYWIAVGSDVSEYRRNCEKIAELSQFRSDLIAMLAHDFRGPLAAISGFAELLLEDSELPAPERAELLQIIRREAHRLANFSADTVAVSQMESGTLSIVRERFDAVQLLRDVVDLYTGRGRVVLNAPEHLQILADRTRLRQVADNLIGNAVKFSPHDSQVQVEILVEGDDTAVISIRDEGIGIPPAEMTAIFRQHERASNVRDLAIPGTGFGLYLSEAIVRHHGGRIDVQSTLNEGTVFTVRLPRAVSSGLRSPEAVFS